MAEIIRGRFSGKEQPKPTPETKEDIAVALMSKQSEMLVFLSELGGTDKAAYYHKESSDLRKTTLKDWSNDDLKNKMLSGNELDWKKDPQWWYAIEQELQDRNLVPRWRL